MSTIIPNFFSVNGVIDTNKSVMENLNNLASAAGAWVTFDTISGQWAVVINKDSAVTKTFTDSDIIGPISISGKGLTEFYSDVQFEFPHQDLNDEKDVVIVSVDPEELYAGEVPNVLNYSLDIVSNPTQIQYLAGIELKQNRLDRIIKFSTDFSSLGLKAGDIIAIDTDKYGNYVFENLKWRITQIEEEDTDSGQIVLSITAMEHNADIYSTTGLTRQQRTTRTGITYQDSNTEIIENRDTAAASSVANSLLLPAAASVGLRLINNLFNKKNIEEAVLPIGFQLTATSGTITAFCTPSTDYVTFYEKEFTPKYSGRYVGQFLFDQNNSGARGLNTDVVAVRTRVYDSFGTRLAQEASGGDGTWYWTDWFLTVDLELNAGQTYKFELACLNDTGVGGNADIRISWNIFAAKD